MAIERNNNLDDCTSREQEQARMGDRAAQSGVVAGLDHCRAGVGFAANEHRTLDRLREEPCEMDAKEKRELEAAIWRACWALMVTFDEAEAAIAKYCK